ncbi:MAG: endolytic transglycosylase MltG [Spirochaetaceae bacterium]|nr:endolytic transglycosylase MltG [Spirochaetaceae bacterium]
MSGFRKISAILCSLLGGVLLAAAGLTGTFLALNATPKTAPHSTETITIDTQDNTAYIEVRDGESARSVGNRLKESGLIKNDLLWKVLQHVNKRYIKAGTYHFNYPLTQTAIQKILQDGKQFLVRITIPEGITIKKTAVILQENNICSEEDFINAASSASALQKFRIEGSSMEGFLYPETYLFEENYPASLVVDKMAETFFEKLPELGINISHLSETELYQKVILASIVEREYRAPEEAPVMAGVFVNRLNSNMKLESCATVEYIITEIEGLPHPERLFNRDIQIQNPYNTYIRAGLPPGPISSPGPLALHAAFFPAKTDYLFFRVVDPSSGKHYFSKTFDDHIKAGEIYVKGKI